MTEHIIKINDTCYVVWANGELDLKNKLLYPDSAEKIMGKYFRETLFESWQYMGLKFNFRISIGTRILHCRHPDKRSQKGLLNSLSDAFDTPKGEKPLPPAFGSTKIIQDLALKDLQEEDGKFQIKFAHIKMPKIKGVAFPQLLPWNLSEK